MATTAYEVPLSPEAQTFAIALGGTTYTLTLRWNAAASAWVLDIADAARAPILSGLLLVTGLDLLGQYGYLGFGGMLIVQTDHAPDVVPTLDNLGQAGRLYFLAEDGA